MKIMPWILKVIIIINNIAFNIFLLKLKLCCNIILVDSPQPLGTAAASTATTAATIAAAAAATITAATTTITTTTTVVPAAGATAATLEEQSQKSTSPPRASFASAVKGEENSAA